jgi:hypothetical protein
VYYLKLSDTNKVFDKSLILITSRDLETNETHFIDYNCTEIDESITFNDVIKFNDDRVKWLVMYKIKNDPEIYLTKKRYNRKEIFNSFNIDETLFEFCDFKFYNLDNYDFVTILEEPGFKIFKNF